MGRKKEAVVGEVWVSTSSGFECKVVELDVELGFIHFENGQSVVTRLLHTYYTFKSDHTELESLDMEGTLLGDSFIDEDSKVVTIAYISDDECSFCGEVQQKIGSTLCVYDNEGFVTPSGARLVSKVDKRYWLGLFPPVACFSETFKWIAKDKGSLTWHIFTAEPSKDDEFWRGASAAVRLGCLNLPMLEDNEWELSKISLADLAIWQKENKNEW